MLRVARNKSSWTEKTWLFHFAHNLQIIFDGRSEPFFQRLDGRCVLSPSSKVAKVGAFWQYHMSGGTRLKSRAFFSRPFSTPAHATPARTRGAIPVVRFYVNEKKP